MASILCELQMGDDMTGSVARRRLGVSPFEPTGIERSDHSLSSPSQHVADWTPRAPPASRTAIEVARNALETA